MFPEMFSFCHWSSGAVIDGPYRYLLWRRWDLGRPQVLWIMLNPSLADASIDDPTLRRVMGFSRSLGFGGLEVVNLFAWRSPSPEVLWQVADAVGPENDRVIQEAVLRASMVIAAWGNAGMSYGRDRVVLSLVRCPVFCLGVTRSGYPRHPLYVKAQTELCLFQEPRETVVPGSW